MRRERLQDGRYKLTRNRNVTGRFHLCKQISMCVCARARARVQVYVPRDMKMCMEMSKCLRQTHALGRHITTNNTNKHAHQVLKT